MSESTKPPKKMFDLRYFRKGLIVVLENAYLESAKIGNEYKLLNCDDHVGYLSKKGRDPSAARPDIAHQCLMTLLDSPLNKAGLLKVYVHTATNMLIDVNPKIRIPRTFKRFSGLMVQLLHKLSIKAEGTRGESVLKMVKNPVTRFFPPNTRVVGMSYSSEKLVDIFDFVPSLFEDSKDIKKEEDDDVKEPDLKKIKTEQDDDENEAEEKEEEQEEEEEVEEKGENNASGSEDSDEEGEEEEEVKVEVMDEPPQNVDVSEGFKFSAGKKAKDKIVVFVIGAMSHGKINIDYTSEEISISQYPLSGSVACGKVCAAFERFYGVV